MTASQVNTIERITKKVERLNGNQTVSVHNLRKGHVLLTIFNVRDLTDVITTTTFIDVEINTKGNITKGFANEYEPKVEKIYPYLN
tara:strand:+ start:68 stop:325 length:258 start_codon:yes stop_codon:yes gene_type:complete